MSPYYKYKKEKFIEKYKCANETLEDLKTALLKYRIDRDKVIRRAIFAYFQDFTEYIVDMCESYIIINDGKIEGNASGPKLIEQAKDMGFFDEYLKDFLINCTRLRNRYTHDYYKREISEQEIEEYCYSKILYLDIFFESSKEQVVLKYKNK